MQTPAGKAVFQILALSVWPHCAIQSEPQLQARKNAESAEMTAPDKNCGSYAERYRVVFATNMWQAPWGHVDALHNILLQAKALAPAEDSTESDVGGTARHELREWVSFVAVHSSYFQAIFPHEIFIPTVLAQYESSADEFWMDSLIAWFLDPFAHPTIHDELLARLDLAAREHGTHPIIFHRAHERYVQINEMCAMFALIFPELPSVEDLQQQP